MDKERQYNIIHKIIIIIIQYNNIVRQWGKVKKIQDKTRGKTRQDKAMQFKTSCKTKLNQLSLMSSQEKTPKRNLKSGTKFKIILTICFTIGFLNTFLFCWRSCGWRVGVELGKGVGIAVYRNVGDVMQLALK
jgi:hypothetical protein